MTACPIGVHTCIGLALFNALDWERPQSVEECEKISVNFPTIESKFAILCPAVGAGFPAASHLYKDGYVKEYSGFEDIIEYVNSCPLLEIRNAPNAPRDLEVGFARTYDSVEKYWRAAYFVAAYCGKQNYGSEWRNGMFWRLKTVFRRDSRDNSITPNWIKQVEKDCGENWIDELFNGKKHNIDQMV